MTIKVINNKAKFAQLKELWNNFLNSCANRDVLFMHQWYSCWVDSFLAGDNMLMVIENSSGQLHAAFPLMKTTYNRGKIRLNIVKSMTNKHSLQFDYLSDNPSPEQFAALLEKAFAETNCSMMFLENISEISFVYKYLQEACKIANCKYVIRKQWENCLINIGDSFEEYFKRDLTSKFRKNVNAAERKALGRGTIKLIQPATSDELENILERILKIEKLSWKAQTGTAVFFDPNDVNFIKKLSHQYLESGCLNLSLVQNGSDDISYFYCIGNFGIIRAMRLAMNEQFRNIGPGMINIKYFLEKKFKEKKFKLLDFGGGWARYKKDWANETQNIYKIFIYKNNIKGNILYKIAEYYNKRYPYEKDIH